MWLRHEPNKNHADYRSLAAPKLHGSWRVHACVVARGNTGIWLCKAFPFPSFPHRQLCPFLPLPKSVGTQSPVTTTHRVTSAMQSQVNHCVRTFVLHVLSSSGHSGYTRLWSKLQTAKNLQNATHWFDEKYSWMIPSPHVNDQQCNPLFAQKQMEQHYMCRML